MAESSTLAYTELPLRMRPLLELAPSPDPTDFETVVFHYVACVEEHQQTNNVPVVFLHGMPDPWFQWHQHMPALAREGYLCVAPDLKGYGQSSKEPGDYRHKAAAKQLAAMLSKAGIEKFYLVTHDRGTVQGDYMAALFTDRVLGYIRGEQHLIHYNPALASQSDLFCDAPYNGVMDDPLRLAVTAYMWLTARQMPDEDTIMIRLGQELAYEGINKAVPRYYGTCTFRQEWLDRQGMLMVRWKCPIVILQGHDSPTQPREWFNVDEIRALIPHANVLNLKFIPGGAFLASGKPRRDYNGTPGGTWGLMPGNFWRMMSFLALLLL